MIWVQNKVKEMQFCFIIVELQSGKENLIKTSQNT